MAPHQDKSRSGLTEASGSDTRLSHKEQNRKMSRAARVQDERVTAFINWKYFKLIRQRVRPDAELDDNRGSSGGSLITREQLMQI